MVEELKVELLPWNLRKDQESPAAMTIHATKELLQEKTEDWTKPHRPTRLRGLERTPLFQQETGGQCDAEMEKLVELDWYGAIQDQGQYSE